MASVAHPADALTVCPASHHAARDSCVRGNLRSVPCGNPLNTLIIHHSTTLKTFITSSPRWLMTLTAMRPDLGFSKGREVSLFKVAQASSLISALRVIL